MTDIMLWTLIAANVAMIAANQVTSRKLRAERSGVERLGLMLAARKTGLDTLEDHLHQVAYELSQAQRSGNFDLVEAILKQQTRH